MSFPFTPEEVVAAYKAKGLRPLFGNYNVLLVDGLIEAQDGFCCALGVMMVGTPPAYKVEEHMWGPSSETQARWHIGALEFSAGFDKGSTKSLLSDLGARCREAVLKEWPELRKHELPST